MSNVSYHNIGAPGTTGIFIIINDDITTTMASYDGDNNYTSSKLAGRDYAFPQASVVCTYVRRYGTITPVTFP
jgi:hypothetical protein